MQHPPDSPPNTKSRQEPAEGSRGNVNVEDAGITNRPIEQEQREQQDLPPRGERKDEDSHA